MIRRIFIAIPAPPEISTYLEILKEDNQHVQGIKWMKFANLHLTIYFIGSINEEDLEKILNRIRLIINTHKIIVLDFDTVSFSPTQNPKMIWARFYKNTSFSLLVNSIHKSLNSIIPEDKVYYKEPIPHITLARFHPVKKTETINIKRPLELSQIRIIACELMESIPSPEGVSYKIAASGLHFKNEES